MNHNSHRFQTRRTRAGLSLLEVMLAIAILGGAMAMIGELIRMGARSAERAKLNSHAQILCDAKMAELSAGVIPLEATNSSEIEDAPSWVYSVSIQSADQVGLLRATITVSNGDVNNASTKSFTLTRFVPDPDYDPYAPEAE